MTRTPGSAPAPPTTVELLGNFGQSVTAIGSAALVLTVPDGAPLSLEADVGGWA